MTPSTTTYALLALLGLRSWTGYELTKQAHRSLHYVWASSEANLYREQQRLVNLGWAAVKEERNGGRTRKHYTITRKGRAALHAWMRTEPTGPTLEVEGTLRLFFADHGSVADLVRSLRATERDVAHSIAELRGFAREYLETGGPFPDRLHLIALAMEMVVRTHMQIQQFCRTAIKEVSSWETTAGLGMTAATHRRLERIVTMTEMEAD